MKVVDTAESLLSSYASVLIIDESPNISSSCERLVETCIATYNTVRTQLLPTPAKCHYTFNLRDLSKVVQGILMGCPEKITVSKYFCDNVIVSCTLHLVVLLICRFFSSSKNIYNGYVSDIVDIWFYKK